jgi:hypothetical protein
MHSRQNPSPRYLALLEQYRRMHAEGALYVQDGKTLHVPPKETFSGESLLRQTGRIKKMIMRTGSKTILDYGAGKGVQYGPLPIRLEGIGEWPDVRSFWKVNEIYCYEPAYEPFNRLPDKKFDGVVCTDVMEHCPEEDVPWIIDELFSYANRFVFANVACYPAGKQLPSGENVHCTIRPLAWWENIWRQTSARYPGIAWEVWVESVVDTPEGKRLLEQPING